MLFNLKLDLDNGGYKVVSIIKLESSYKIEEVSFFKTKEVLDPGKTYMYYMPNTIWSESSTDLPKCSISYRIETIIWLSEQVHKSGSGFEGEVIYFDNTLRDRLIDADAPGISEELAQ